MTTTFEQPEHLNLVAYRRLVRVCWRIFLPCGALLSALLLIGLWRRAAAGEQVSTWRWLAAASVGFLEVGLIRLGMRCEKSKRRYLEFRGDRLFLSGRGGIATRRFISWSFLPDPLEPRYTRLQLVYRFGLGRQRWSMLLDDNQPLAALGHALMLHLPQSKAA
jgi:hypothetical protein